MKLFCPLSGVSYKTSIGYGHGKAPHPVFYLPLKSLISQHLDAFCSGKLKEEEIHLFGCALLHKLPVVWEDTVQNSESIQKRWKNNIEKLAAICLKYDTRTEKDMPRYHIDKRNNDLGNLKGYLESVDEAIAELSYGEDAPVPTYMTRNAEAAILRMLRGSISRAEKRETFPKLMADWAASVGDFPRDIVNITENETRILGEYWKSIIQHVFTHDDPLTILSTTITPGDLDELIEHCETHIEVGTIHSLALLRRLREVRNILDEFRSPVSRSSLSTAKSQAISASFLNGESEALSNTINIDRPKIEVPSSEPLRKDYPNAAAYIRAKIAWQKGY